MLIGVEGEDKFALFALQRVWKFEGNQCGFLGVAAILINAAQAGIEKYCPSPDIVLRCDCRDECVGSRLLEGNGKSGGGAEDGGSNSSSELHVD